MEVSVKQRLMHFIKSKNISVREFERLCGLSNGYMKSLRHAPKSDKLSAILSTFPELNDTWLLTGEGSMLNKEQSPPLSPINDTVIGNNDGGNFKPQHTIKYYPNVDGSMGGVQFLDDPNEMVCDITIPGYSDCKFAINAYGDSMYPLIKSGQIILMSEWSESFIDWGRIYLVVTKSGYRVIKRLYPGASDTTITCKSENPETNPPFEIEKSDINKVYLVKGWICRDAI